MNNFMIANALITLTMTDEQVDRAGSMTKEQAIAVLRRAKVTIPDSLKKDTSHGR